jgi:hypothetical protein
MNIQILSQRIKDDEDKEVTLRKTVPTKFLKRDMVDRVD